MKRISLFYILIIFLITNASAQSWLLGNKVINTNSLVHFTAPGTGATDLGSLSGTYTGSDMLDISEGSKFYIRDKDVYDDNGQYVFTLPIWKMVPDWCSSSTNVYDGISGEVAIVKRPGTDLDFYVIYEQDYTGIQHAGLFYIVVRLVYNSATSSYTPTLAEDMLAPISCYGTSVGTNPQKIFYEYTQRRSTISFAVSKAINSANEFHLYTSSSDYGYLGHVRRYKISNSGITFEQVIITSATSAMSVNHCDFNTHQLILSPDEHFLAWTADGHPSSLCNTATKGVFILPLINHNNYDVSAYSFSPQLIKIPSTSAVSGISFSPDSRKIYYTNSDGLNYAFLNHAATIATSSAGIVPGTTGFAKSFLSLGYNNQVFGIEQTSSSPAVTSDLACFDVEGTNAKTSVGLQVLSNNSNNLNSDFRLPKNVVGGYDPDYRVTVDINTLCAPGFSSPATPVQFQVTPGDVSSYYYNWYELPGNTTVLDDPTSPTPQIISATTNASGDRIAYYYLTVTSKNYFGPVASFVIKLKLKTSGYDLASRDAYLDWYNEPNDQFARTGDDNVWESPDIWNRNQEDGDVHQEHEAPEFRTIVSNTSFIYTKVRNIGCESSPATAQVKLYWTAGGGPETWSINPGQNFWVDKQFINGIPSTVPHGLHINDISLPSIAPGDNIIVHTTWTPPNPADYRPTADPISSVELCFLSRIVDMHNIGSPDGMTFRETEASTGNNVTIRANITKNNNIITRNTGVTNLGHKPPRGHLNTGLVLVGNAESVATNFSFTFVNDNVLHGGTSRLNEYMTVKVGLGDLFDIWKTAGLHGTYSAIDFAGKSVIFDGANTMKLDSILIDTAKEYPITISMYLNDSASADSMPHETIRFRQMLGNDIYGCYNFNVQGGKDVQNPKGVIAVTEVSNGPSGDCEYAEMVVANCGSDSAGIVDVSGWIIDDNSGNFNSSGCSTGVGIAQGHYRLSFDDTWKYVPVGSVLVLYNHDANCYALSDTFRIDTTAAGLVYWIPVGGTTAAPYGNPHVERFGARPATSLCSYCADSGITSYAKASSWSSTIGLNNTADAFQVRCPGCNSTYSGAPAFYHGIGYGPATGTNAFVSIPAGSYNLGGPVINGSGAGYKYVFNGSSVTDLGSAAQWSRTTADAAGSAPASLGHVPSALSAAITGHSLGLPCCTIVSAKQSSGSLFNGVDALKVYPNPTDGIVYFEFAQATSATIKILTVTGKVIDTISISSNNIASVSVSGYATGMYIYQVIDENGKIQTGKLMVK